MEVKTIRDEIKQFNIRETMAKNPIMFRWLGKSLRRKIDFEDGYNYAVRDVLILLKKVK